jgi:hypothetical protein
MRSVEQGGRLRGHTTYRLCGHGQGELSRARREVERTHNSQAIQKWPRRDEQSEEVY